MNKTRNIFDDDLCICPADMQLKQQKFYKRVSTNKYVSLRKT